jgi:hypothetical protein
MTASQDVRVRARLREGKRPETLPLPTSGPREDGLPEGQARNDARSALALQRSDEDVLRIRTERRLVLLPCFEALLRDDLEGGPHGFQHLLLFP